MTVAPGAVNQRLRALTQLGTSVWLDQMRRSLITEGELQRLVEQDSLRGVTSNPAIFEKAILGSDDYDTELRELAPDVVFLDVAMSGMTGLTPPAMTWDARR